MWKNVLNIACLLLWVFFTIYDVYRFTHGVEVNPVWFVIDPLFVIWFIYCTVTDN